jgi:ABC-type dipeptide/oligopeptide/nickel transport system permease subunit
LSQVASDIGPGPVLQDAAGTEAVTGKTPWQLFWARFKQDKASLIGLFFISLLILIALLAPLISNVVGFGPNELPTQASGVLDEFGLPVVGPSADHFFGVDLNGRDLFVRVVYGARTSLQVAIIATGFSVFIGLMLGMTAGYYGRWIDTIISRTIDILLSIPYLLLALGISAACSTTVEGCLGGFIKPGMRLVIFIIVFFTWPFIARIVRGSTLSIREKEFIEASRSLGASNRRIMFKEILPNLVAPVIIYSTLLIPSNIIFESSLSFLGLGVPQDVPSWGAQLSEAADIYEVAWWTMLFPGLMLVLTTLSFNLLGDGLRDALDPRTGR